MSGSRIAVVQGHPDPAGSNFIEALADAYTEGAKEAGHEVRRIDIGQLDYAPIQSPKEYGSEPPEAIQEAQATLKWADHWVILYPLWLGAMPAMLKGFLEQVFRPGFGFDLSGRLPTRHLKGKSARIVITMGMPALAYRLWFRAHSLKSLKRNILGFSGIRPIRTTLFGDMGKRDEQSRKGCLEAVRQLGTRGR